mmetsp:Transcript_2098/g.6582  ORF Transcript_2098/g.6582 Transcript_2098/m.6582 type:complete len:216 (+) Transcript_2098:2-649(+)
MIHARERNAGQPSSSDGNQNLVVSVCRRLLAPGCVQSQNVELAADGGHTSRLERGRVDPLFWRVARVVTHELVEVPVGRRSLDEGVGDRRLAAFPGSVHGLPALAALLAREEVLHVHPRHGAPHEDAARVPHALRPRPSLGLARLNRGVLDRLPGCEGLVAPGLAGDVARHLLMAAIAGERRDAAQCVAQPCSPGFPGGIAARRSGWGLLLYSRR